MSEPETRDVGTVSYPRLFSEGTIGALRLANRFVRSATAKDPATYRQNRVPHGTIDLYRRLARSGVGLSVGLDLRRVIGVWRFSQARRQLTRNQEER